jgi:CBS domain containing-hemolysin-like protein
MVNVVLATGQLVLALFLVVLNGFFVASEFAFVRIRATSVEQLAAEGRPGSGALQDVMEGLDDYLAVTQLGITIASLGLGWVGEPAVASLLEPVLAPVVPESAIHLISFAIGFSVITFLHVVFGELAPKTIAIAQAERLSLFVAPPMRLFYYLFYPGLVVFNGTANAFTRLIGIPPASETDETLEEREIRRVLARASDDGNIDTTEVEMIEGVFDLDDTTVTEIMVPRPDVVSVSGDASLSDVRSTALEAGHTRYPVVDGETVVGVIDLKDLLRASDGDETVTAGELAHGTIFVPETTTISNLLLQFRDEHQQMAVVIDEWGAIEGLATVEDVVEAIVGDLRDRFDEDEPSLRERPDGSYAVDGSVPISTVNDELGADFESDFETVAGLVLGRLDRAPDCGDTVTEDGYILEVTDVSGTRITAVQVREDEANK